MQTQSRSPVDVTVDHDGQHLPLEASQRRGLAKMQMVVDPCQAAPDREVDEADSGEARDVSVLTLRQAQHDLPNPPRVFLGDGLDASHGILLLADSRQPPTR